PRRSALSLHDALPILLRRDERRRSNDGTHASPRKTEAGRMLASRRSGYALRIATMIVRATATGYTISRGRAATPKTALPKPIDKIGRAHVLTPVTSLS